jgi:hypothetical protein
MFTAHENGRFPRTLVNRLWKQLYGRGLVEPVDDLDNEPWSRDLLDWLAAEFVDHRYDIKHILRTIMTSRSYQLAADAPAGEDEGPYTFRGPRLRRLSAEQFVDGISQVTGEWRVLTPRNSGSGSYARDWRFKSSPLTRALGRPIRDQVYTERNTKATTLQALELVNGKEISRMLSRGARRMLDRLPDAPAPLADSGNMGSGLAKPFPEIDVTKVSRLHLLLEDMESYDPKRVVAGWTGAALVRADGSRVPLTELKVSGEYAVRSVQTRERLIENVIVPRFPSRLTVDIGGKRFVQLEIGAAVEQQPSAVGILPNVRFFVFSEEPVRDELIPPAGDAPVIASPVPRRSDKLIDAIWWQAYGRNPAPLEAAAAKRFLGRKPGIEGLEDLLWSVFLSSEYQFIQ